jgi:sec-independent protein translocase protein TatC
LRRAKKKQDDEYRVQQLIHHVKEIRMRLFIVVCVLIIGMCLGYAFYIPIFDLLRSPLHTELHYTSPAGSFNFVLEVCFVVGILFALPVMIYNIIMFIQPALEQRLTRLRVYLTTLLSLVLALCGAGFAFYIILPLALEFFFKFEINGLVALLSASDYLNFVINIIVTFAIMFQLPLIINTIDHIRPLPIKTLLKAEKYVILGGIVIAVIVPFALDPVVQALIASPIIILYNLSILGVIVQHMFKKKVKAPIADLAQTSITQGIQFTNNDVPAPNLLHQTHQSTVIHKPHGNRANMSIVTPQRKNYYTKRIDVKPKEIIHHNIQNRAIPSSGNVRQRPRLISDIYIPSTTVERIAD